MELHTAIYNLNKQNILWNQLWWQSLIYEKHIVSMSKCNVNLKYCLGNLWLQNEKQCFVLSQISLTSGCQPESTSAVIDPYECSVTCSDMFFLQLSDCSDWFHKPHPITIATPHILSCFHLKISEMLALSSFFYWAAKLISCHCLHSFHLHSYLVSTNSAHGDINHVDHLSKLLQQWKYLRPELKQWLKS